MKIAILAILSLTAIGIYTQGVKIHSIVSRTHTATCPAGFQAASCICGMKCGSTHITNDRKSKCNCQCVPTDWTAANCVQFRDERSSVQKLNIIEATANGQWATCPAGFKVTGCSCGNGCGSTTIHEQTKCQCHCANSGWAKAYCAKPVDNRFELNCQYRSSKTNPLPATPGYTAVSCSCGNSCNSYTLANNQCYCHPGCGADWTAINECRFSKTAAAIAADKAKAAAEALRKRAAEEAARKKAAEEAARKKAAEEAARKKAAEEAARKKAAEEEAARKKAAEEAARKKAAEEEAAKRRQRLIVEVDTKQSPKGITHQVKNITLSDGKLIDVELQNLKEQPKPNEVEQLITKGDDNLEQVVVRLGSSKGEKGEWQQVFRGIVKRDDGTPFRVIVEQFEEDTEPKVTVIPEKSGDSQLNKERDAKLAELGKREGDIQLNIRFSKANQPNSYDVTTVVDIPKVLGSRIFLHLFGLDQKYTNENMKVKAYRNADNTDTIEINFLHKDANIKTYSQSPITVDRQNINRKLIIKINGLTEEFTVNQ